MHKDALFSIYCTVALEDKLLPVFEIKYCHNTNVSICTFTFYNVFTYTLRRGFFAYEGHFLYSRNGTKVGNKSKM